MNHPQSYNCTLRNISILSLFFFLFLRQRSTVILVEGFLLLFSLIENLYEEEPNASAGRAAWLPNIKFISQALEFMVAVVGVGVVVVRPGWVEVPALPLTGCEALCKLLLILGAHLKWNCLQPHGNMKGLNDLTEVKEHDIAGFMVNVQ